VLRAHAERPVVRRGRGQLGDRGDAELIWGLGVDLADKPRRLHQEVIGTVQDIVGAWVAPGSDVYVETAARPGRETPHNG
jgi:hypothetical protein